MAIRDYYKLLNKLKFLSQYSHRHKSEFKDDILSRLYRKISFDPLQWVEALPDIPDFSHLFHLATTLSAVAYPVKDDWAIIKLLKFKGVEKERVSAFRWLGYILNSEKDVGILMDILIRPDQFVKILLQTGISISQGLSIQQLHYYSGIQMTARRVGGQFIRIVECTSYDRYRNRKIIAVRFKRLRCPICKSFHYIDSDCIYDPSLVQPYTGYWEVAYDPVQTKD